MTDTMAETPGQAPADAARPAAARPGRPRRLALAGTGLATGAAGAVHWLGWPIVLVIVACAALLVLLALALWRLPHLRRHFASPYGRRPAPGSPARPATGWQPRRQLGSDRRPVPHQGTWRRRWPGRGRASYGGSRAPASAPAGRRGWRRLSPARPRSAPAPGSSSAARPGRISSSRGRSGGRQLLARPFRSRGRSAGSQPGKGGTHTGQRPGDPHRGRAGNVSKPGQPAKAGNVSKPGAGKSAGETGKAAKGPNAGDPAAPKTKTSRLPWRRAKTPGRADDAAPTSPESRPGPATPETGRRWRRRRPAAPAGPGADAPAAPAAVKPPDPQPRPASPVRRPAGQADPRPAPTPHVVAGGPVSQPVQAVAEAAEQQIGGFTPTSRSDIHAFFQQLPELFRSQGGAFHNAAENMSTEHVHQAVIDALHELGQVTTGIADHAEEVWTSHLSQHQLWLND